ncbi:MAG: prepilin-type N-terminal cleavage/methylation domain-containing protein [candidate division WOR-3 bacterium]
MKKGFTLIEIIISITIIAIAFLSLYQFLIKSLSFSENIRKKEVALLLARKKAEHTLGGIDSQKDTVSVDTLDKIIYETILKMNKELPPLCSVKVYVNKKRILAIQFLKEL